MDLNTTVNITQNETLKQAAANVGAGSMDVVQIASGLFNNQLTDGVAHALNGLLGVTWISGALVLSVVVLAMLYWKWSAICSWFGSIGSYVILTAIAYVVAKGMHVF